MTRSAWLLVLIIFWLVLGAFISRNGDWLMLAIPVALYLGVSILLAPHETGLGVTRTIQPQKVEIGEQVGVKLEIKQASQRLEEVYLEDRQPPGVRLLEGKTLTLAALFPGDQTELSYRLQAGRGRYLMNGLQATMRDPFGLFEWQRALPAAGVFLVLPNIARLRRVPIRPQATRGFIGPIPSRRGGTGTDFYGVREYQVGDTRRRINWRVTARHPEGLYANDFEQERIADVGLILDARQVSDIRFGHNSLFEYSVSAAASLAQAFLEDSHRVGLLVYGYGLDRIFPGYGKVQFERIRRLLAHARTGMNYALDSLENLPTRLFPARSQLVIISPLTREDTSPLIRLRALGYAVLLLSPNPIEFELRSTLPAPQPRQANIRPVFRAVGALSGSGIASLPAEAQNLPVRLAHLERTLMLKKLRQAGIQVVDWRVHLPLEEAMEMALKAQPLHRRVVA